MHLVGAEKKEPTPYVLTKNNHPSFIGCYILPDLSICDSLMDHVDDPDGKRCAGTVQDPNGGTEVDVKAKDSIDCTLFESDIYAPYSQQLQLCLNLYLEEYKQANRLDRFLDNVEWGNVQKYPIGGGYHTWHGERSGISTAHRHLVYMTYLNDVTDGGETEFMYQKLKIKPKKGLTLIWPADWTHTHRGIPSMTQVKYIATGWYCYSGERG